MLSASGSLHPSLHHFYPGRTIIDFYINHEKCRIYKSPRFFCSRHSRFSTQACRPCTAVTLADWLTGLAVCAEVRVRGALQVETGGPEQQCSMTRCSQSHHYSCEMQLWRLMGYTEVKKKDECFHWVWQAIDWETGNLVKFAPVPLWVHV